MYRCRQRPGNVKAQSVCNDRFAVIVEEPRLRFEMLVYDWKVNSHLKMIKKNPKKQTNKHAFNLPVSKAVNFVFLTHHAH